MAMGSHEALLAGSGAVRTIWEEPALSPAAGYGWSDEQQSVPKGGSLQLFGYFLFPFESA
jgi:hypothetical protein